MDGWIALAALVVSFATVVVAVQTRYVADTANYIAKTANSIADQALDVAGDARDAEAAQAETAREALEIATQQSRLAEEADLARQREAQILAIRPLSVSRFDIRQEDGLWILRIGFDVMGDYPLMGLGAVVQGLAVHGVSEVSALAVEGIGEPGTARPPSPRPQSDPYVIAPGTKNASVKLPVDAFMASGETSPLYPLGRVWHLRLEYFGMLGQNVTEYYELWPGWFTAHTYRSDRMYRIRIEPAVRNALPLDLWFGSPPESIAETWPAPPTQPTAP